MEEYIILRGCRTHNLKNIHLQIPLKKITAVVGVSGAGKTSLVLHTLHAEAYLRYIESISPYIRQFLDMVEKPDVDALENLPPALAHGHKHAAGSKRSIVATAAGVYDYLRLLYARIADFHCPGCGRIVRRYSTDEMVDLILALGVGRVQVCFEYRGDAAFLLNRGYYFYVDKGEKKPVSAAVKDKKIRVLLDEIEISKENRSRIFEAVEQSLAFNGRMVILLFRQNEILLPAVLFCPYCQVQYHPADEHLFVLTVPPGRQGGEYGVEASPASERLQPYALAFRIQGRSIADFLAFTVAQAADFIRSLDPEACKNRIHPEVFADILARLDYLQQCGLLYLPLDRQVSSLSRGEFQYIILASIFGSTLSDSLMIIDQPSSGLHPNEYQRLKGFLQRLKMNDNTVVLIDHHPEVVRMADHVIELGPGPGSSGGEVVFAGSCERFFSESATLTEKCFLHPHLPHHKEKSFDEWLQFKNASTHNLKGFDFSIPLHALTIITGVSGAGKSALLFHEIFSHLKKDRRFSEVVFLDPGKENVYGNTHVAGFFGISLPLRKFYAALPQSRRLNYLPGHFSFHSSLGRCQDCSGKGFREIEMQFLPVVKVRCAACNGSGFTPDVLKVTWRGSSIARILRLTILEFGEMFAAEMPELQPVLKDLIQMGLGYLQLGQKLGDLSSGELQKVRLCRNLNTGKSGMLFLIDEPSFGLHFQDLQVIGGMLGALVARGNTLVVVDFNRVILGMADFILELGPEGGDKGGYLLFAGAAAAFHRKKSRKKT